jgi:hypothetical protein
MAEEIKIHEVEIIIDKKHLRSPTATTGHALYLLGEVPAGYDLFEEIHGHGDDPLVPNDTTPINLENGTHFYTAKQNLNPGHGNVYVG